MKLWPRSKKETVDWWWSRRLRESVELFGQFARGYSGFEYSQYGRGRQSYLNGEMRGPYYTGMSFIMSVPSFLIRLCSPTSTSMVLAVACKFSGSAGIILQLNMKVEMSKFAAFIKGFDCSWISKFKEEDERYIL